jgi:hypothetical protein
MNKRQSHTKKSESVSRREFGGLAAIALAGGALAAAAPLTDNVPEFVISRHRILGSLTLRCAKLSLETEAIAQVARALSPREFPKAFAKWMASAKVRTDGFTRVSVLREDDLRRRA